VDPTSITAPIQETAGALTPIRPRLEFWFDFASTYSYVAAMRIEALCREAGVALLWKPFLLGPIFALQGWHDSHFNLNPRRGDYMWRDLERLCAKFALPWRHPTRFPRQSTLAARVGCHVAGEAWAGDYVRAVYVANFGEDREIGERAVLAGILTALGQPAEAIIDRAEAPPERGTLRAHTERAIALGIFGAPNCWVNDEELFWGEEALEDAVAWACGRSERPASPLAE
jgi:2-hydroxychromene-2-carboxylate isomerase